MNIFSGRFDMKLDYEETTIMCADFAFLFQMENFIFAFENRTKSGLPCKAHIHWVGETTKSQRSIQRYFQDMEYDYSTKLLTKSDFPKVIHYTLKQQDCILTDYDPDVLKLYMEASRQYNESIQINKMSEHIEVIINKLKTEEKETYTRDDIFYEIAYYIVEWNQDPKNIRKIKNPNGNSLLQIVQYIETKLLPASECVHRYLRDNFMITEYTSSSLTTRIKRHYDKCEQAEDILLANETLIEHGPEEHQRDNFIDPDRNDMYIDSDNED
jgi:hypothetical protein